MKITSNKRTSGTLAVAQKGYLTLAQWIGKDGVVGKYFAPVGSDPSKLGISTEGRTLKQFTLTKDMEVLKSTAKDFKGNKGGGTQYFNPKIKENSN